MTRISLVIATGLLTACTSTYHPEYHPVTTTTVTQVGHAQATPIVIQTPPAADPEAFFDTSHR